MEKKHSIKKYVIICMAMLLIIAEAITIGIVFDRYNKSQDKNSLNEKQIISMKSEQESISKKNTELESQYEEQSEVASSLSDQVDKLTEKGTESDSAYKDLCPDMYVDSTPSGKEVSKIVYLTFDDGPSELTPQFLAVLKEKGVNATFFVTYQPQLADTYKQIINDGNVIQVHTATHAFKEIYLSVENYLADFEQVYNFVYETTGTKPDCFRFPGGSTTGYAKSTVKAIAKELDRRGFTFYDWNVSVGDGSNAATHDSILEKIKAESDGKNKIVMLAHDSGNKTETLSALGEIIDYYKENGYSFGVINRNVDPECAQFIDWNE